MGVSGWDERRRGYGFYDMRKERGKQFSGRCKEGAESHIILK